MSEQTLEVVYAGFRAWNAGDMEAYRELLDPGFVLRNNDIPWPEPGPWVGRDVAMREFEMVRETWDVNTTEPVGEVVEQGDRVLARFVWSAIGRGAEVEMQISSIYAVRGPVMVTMDFFADHAAALEAIGA